MNDKNPNQKENPTPQSVPEGLVAANELSGHTSNQLPSEEQPHEKGIDLNELFPDAEANLNDLFPDMEVKHLLKRIMKNKKDMNAIKERLTTENEISDEAKEGFLTEDDSFGPNTVENNSID